MPLLKRKEWFPETPNLTDLKPEEEVFVVRATGEVLTDYQAYLDRIQLLRSRQWSCRYTGKSSLSYEEALLEEEKSRSSLSKFPQECEASVVSIVHHSNLALDQLVNKVYEAHKPCTNGKENEPKDKTKHPLPRSLIRCWMIENCTQHEVPPKTRLWAVSSELADKYSLDQTLPEGATLVSPRKVAPTTALAAAIGTPEEVKNDAERADKAGSSGAGSGKEPVSNGVSIEEQEKGLSSGSVKHVLFQILKSAGSQGLSAKRMSEISIEQQIYTQEEVEKKRSQIHTALCTNPKLFARVSKGVYALRAFVDGSCNGSVDATALTKPAPPAEVKPTAVVKNVAPKPSGPSEKDEQDVEVDSITKVEVTAKKTQAAAEQRRAEVNKAEAAVAAARAKLEAAEQLIKTPVKRRSLAPEEAEHMPAMELPEEFREYTGDPADRKALMAWKKGRQTTEVKLQAKKDAWLKAQRSKREHAKREAVAGKKGLEKVLQKAVETLEAAVKALAQAEKAAAEADKVYQREVGKAEAKAAREREREERLRMKEKRKQEALDAKRYPIDDLQLLKELRERASAHGDAAPAEDVAQPASWMTKEEGDRLCNALYISDFLTSFKQQLDQRTLYLAELDKMLGAGILDEVALSKLEDMDKDDLDELYLGLLRFLLNEAKREKVAGKTELMWLKLLGEATWPEVLRRFVCTRSSAAPKDSLAQHAALAGSMLGVETVSELTCDQHLTLLHFLCDEVLQTDKFRDLLARRMEEADDAKRDLREGMAEDKKKLKELLDREKEERRAKREADLKKREALLAKRKELEEAAAAAGQDGAAPMQIDEAELDNDNNTDDAEEEPSWELPEQLQEYGGDPADRKAMLQFRQIQQEERKKLEVLRNKWLADVRARRKARDAEKRAAAELERQKAKEKAEAEEMLLRRQEAYEKEIEKYAIRRQPIGTDRFQRKYWWGIGSLRHLLIVQDETGSWGSFSSIGEVDSLMESLDKRGVRELALSEALDKKYRSITDAMKKMVAQTKKEVDPKLRIPGERQQPTRKGKAFQDAKDSKDEGKQGAEEEQQVVVGVERFALEHVCSLLLDLAADASAAKLHPLDGSWKDWKEAVKRASDEDLQEEGLEGKRLVTALRQFVKSKLLEVEGVLWGASKDGQKEEEGEAGSDANEEEEGSGEQEEEGSAEDDSKGSDKMETEGDSVDDVLETGDEGSIPGDKTKLWVNKRQREAWRNDTSQCQTVVRVAYCAEVLTHMAEGFLDALKAARGAKQNSKRKADGGQNGRANRSRK